MEDNDDDDDDEHSSTQYSLTLHILLNLELCLHILWPCCTFLHNCTTSFYLKIQTPSVNSLFFIYSVYFGCICNNFCCYIRPRWLYWAPPGRGRRVGTLNRFIKSACGAGWFNLCTLVTQCATGVQPPAAPGSDWAS